MPLSKDSSDHTKNSKSDLMTQSKEGDSMKKLNLLNRIHQKLKTKKDSVAQINNDESDGDKTDKQEDSIQSAQQLIDKKQSQEIDKVSQSQSVSEWRKSVSISKLTKGLLDFVKVTHSKNNHKGPTARSKQFSRQYSSNFDLNNKFSQSTKCQKAEKQFFKCGTGELPGKLKISSWNINGIRNAINKNHLSHYLKHEDPDILCMTETKVDEVMFKKQPINLFGYSGYWKFCSCSAGYSGVVIFSKYQPIRVIQGLTGKWGQSWSKEASEEPIEKPGFSQDFDKEGRVITLEFQKMFLVNIYMPNAGSHLERLEHKVSHFQPRIFGFCDELKKSKPVVFTGDFNTALTELDTHVPKKKDRGEQAGINVAERKSLQRFLNGREKQASWIDTYRLLHPKQKAFTWWNIKFLGRDNNVGRRIDYFFISKELRSCLVSSDIKPDFKGSDHCPIQLTLELRNLQIQPSRSL